jgi:hypothetical protein
MNKTARSLRSRPLHAASSTAPTALLALAVAMASCTEDAASPEREPGRVQERLGIQATEQIPDPPAGLTWSSSPAICAVASASGGAVLHVFGRASNNAIYQSYFDTAWHGPFYLGGGMQGNPACASWGVDRIDLAVQSATTGGVMHKFYAGASGWGPTDMVTWEPIGRSAVTSGPSITSMANGTLDLFARGAANDLVTLHFGPGWAADWTSVGFAGELTSDPAAASSEPGVINVLWRATSGQVAQAWTGNAGATWSASEALGGNTTYRPAVTSRARGLLDVLARDAAGNLLQQWFDVAWSSQVLTGTGSARGPSVTSSGPGHLDVAYLGADGHFWHAIGQSQAVATQRNDASRTSAKLDEIELNVANVASGRFGHLFDMPVDGNVFAQPLYAPRVRTADGRLRNLIIVATQHDSVYAFDADDGTHVWDVSLGYSAPIPNPDFCNNKEAYKTGPCAYNMRPEVGIVSTPVIDVATQSLYVVAFTGTDAAGQRLPPHKLAVVANCEAFAARADGSHRYATTIHKLTLGTGASAQKREITAPSFDPKQQMQRPALLLSGGRVYVAFGGHVDTTPYSGWIFNYDAGDLNAAYDAFNDELGGSRAGIWQSGTGPSADAFGNVFVMTGDGPFDAPRGQYGDSFLWLQPGSGGRISVQGSFTPRNQSELNLTDRDLGSSAPLYVRSHDLLVGGGKEGVLYALQKQSSPANALTLQQQFQATKTECAGCGGLSNIHGSPAYWASTTGEYVYVWGEQAKLKAYALYPKSCRGTVWSQPFCTTTVSCAGLTTGAYGECGLPSSESPTVLHAGMPGGFLSISSNQGVVGTGIVWASHPSTADATTTSVDGVLEAFDAADVSRRLWGSDGATGDAVGLFAKYAPPTIANGKVYLGTFAADTDANTLPVATKVKVYGLKTR